MEKLKITLELTLEEARFVLNELEQFRAAKSLVNEDNTFKWCSLPKPNQWHLINKEPQPEPKPFKLQHGKRYKRRDGEITGSLVENDGAYSKTHPFKDPESHTSWQPNGQFGSGKGIHKLDLIEEVQ